MKQITIILAVVSLLISSHVFANVAPANGVTTVKLFGNDTSDQYIEVNIFDLQGFKLSEISFKTCLGTSQKASCKSLGQSERYNANLLDLYFTNYFKLANKFRIGAFVLAFVLVCVATLIAKRTTTRWLFGVPSLILFTYSKFVTTEDAKIMADFIKQINFLALGSEVNSNIIIQINGLTFIEVETSLGGGLRVLDGLAEEGRIK